MGIGAAGQFLIVSGGIPAWSSIISKATLPLQIISTEDAASVQVLRLDGDRATPVAGDAIYQSLYVSNTAGTQIELARILAVSGSLTSPNETGGIRLQPRIAGGTFSDSFRLVSSQLSLNNEALTFNALLTSPAHLGATGSRVTKGWFTDITSTNAVVVDSDISTKLNIQPYAGDALAIIRKIRISTGQHVKSLDPEQRTKLMIVAQDIDEPLIVRQIPAETVEPLRRDDGTLIPSQGFREAHLGYDSGGISLLALKGIQELDARVRALGG